MSTLTPTSARASIFDNGKRWTPSSTGWVQIHVCVDPASSAAEKGDGPNAGLIHDPNPSLDEVLRHVRRALASSWEKNSAVRFAGWESCSTPATGVVQLYIHPDAKNESIIGTDSASQPRGVHFQPWGNSFNRCIQYNASTTHVGYSFDCVEQYAIHEFGHALGFLHEWEWHPSTPQACINNRLDAQKNDPTVTDLWNRLNPNEYSSVFDSARQYTITSPTYDFDSIMTYHDPDCSHKTGVRFGSTNLSTTDILGVTTVYQPVPQGTYDVGVLADAGGCGGNTESITIFTDSEDNNNGNSLAGWSGATQVGSNLQFEFCRADGRLFGKVNTPSGSRTADYAVLLLGQACPAGSQEFVRYMDNEDSNNQNYITGTPSPNRQNFGGGTNTQLYFCLFRPEVAGGFFMSNFPLLSRSYGVFATSDHPLAGAAGTIHSDDEDNNNQNSFIYQDLSMISAVQRIVSGNANTDFKLTRVLDPVYPLTTGVSPAGAGIVSPPSGLYWPQSGKVDLMATPSPGYVFSSWSGPVVSPSLAVTSMMIISPTTVTANFVEGPTSLSALLTNKIGGAAARQWSISFTNSGPGIANNVTVNTFNLTQVGGATCSPTLATQLPHVMTTGVAAATTGVGSLQWNFTGCPANARFTAALTFSANSGAVTGSLTLFNQFQ
jgi:hypothetical protein